ncbi:PAS domain-containing protein [Yersinia mollaretii]|uniref:PAS domain-containing protein n=1 Tax=Yersinia mollaretii TaxID=33060 RepID=UPI0011A7ADD8|nr:LuxR C-terminal-related transcriptional regulator [Yersinia mollaretii]
MDKINHENRVGSNQLDVGSLGSLLSFMENNEDPWGVKDCESRIIYANKATLKYSQLPLNFNIEGRLDNECPAKWAEFASDLQKQDREVEMDKKRVAMIQTCLWGQEHTLCEKFPLFDNEKRCIGTLFHVTKFNFISIYDLFINKEIPPVLVMKPPTSDFTKKELEVIFYLLQSLNAKEIGEKLNLSHRTISNKLQLIYGKAKVNSLSAFKEYCKVEGIDRYIPERLIKPGCQFI